MYCVKGNSNDCGPLFGGMSAIGSVRYRRFHCIWHTPDRVRPLHSGEEMCTPLVLQHDAHPT